MNIKIIKQTIPWQWKKISNLKETENDVKELTTVGSVIEYLKTKGVEE